MFRLLSVLITLTFFSTFTFAAWTPWVSLGGEIRNDPAACTVRGDTWVVAKGVDDRIWYRKRTLSTGVWDAWKVIPGTHKFTGSPSIACRIYNGKTFFEVFAVSQYSLFLTHTYQTGLNTFTPWAKWPLKGTATEHLAMGSGLSTPSLPEYNIMPQLFAKGNDNGLYHSLCYPQACYTRWNILSLNTTGDPAAIFQSPSRLDLVLMDQQQKLYHRIWSGGIWGQSRDLGNTFLAVSSPDIVSRGQGLLDLFVRGPNNNIYHKRNINDIWGNWVNIGGQATSGPGATTYASNARMMVFVRWSNGELYYRAWAP